MPTRKKGSPSIRPFDNLPLNPQPQHSSSREEDEKYCKMAASATPQSPTSIMEVAASTGMRTALCKYGAGNCGQSCAIKDNGSPHRFCEYHRQQANRIQRQVRSKKRLLDAVSDDGEDSSSSSKRRRNKVLADVLSETLSALEAEGSFCLTNISEVGLSGMEMLPNSLHQEIKIDPELLHPHTTTSLLENPFSDLDIDLFAAVPGSIGDVWALSDVEFLTRTLLKA